MSFELLNALNGKNKGAFADFLARRKTVPNICWYPSAGEDFRDLLYLSPAYGNFHKASEADPTFPDLYLHTDYFPNKWPPFLDGKALHFDSRTMIRVDVVEELPNLNLPLDADLVDFPEAGPVTGRVFFLTVDVHSVPLKTSYKAHLVYAFVENAAFCSGMLLRYRARLSHVLHIRYGGSFGGGTATGGWLRGVLPQLSCQMFISDGRHDDWSSGDTFAVQHFPSLDLQADQVGFRSIRTLPASGWSNYGTVEWLRRE